MCQLRHFVTLRCDVLGLTGYRSVKLSDNNCKFKVKLFLPSFVCVWGGGGGGGIEQALKQIAP